MTSHYSIITLFVSATLLLGVSSDARALDQKVLLIGLDGVRADVAELMLSAGQLPNIQSLINNGSYSNLASTSDITGSWGGWMDVMRGVHRDEHEAGYWSENGVPITVVDPTQPEAVANPNLFERLESYNGSLNTISYITWSNLHDVMDSSSSSAGVDRGADIRNFTNYSSDGDNIVTSQAVTYLDAQSGGVSTNDPDVMFFYQADPDIAGHNNGFGPDSLSTNINDFSSGYRNELIETDNNVGQVLTALNNRPGVINGSEEWLIVLTSDHGGTGGGHSQNRVAERLVPFVVSGLNTSVAQQTPSSNPLFVQAKNIDVVPTILNHLGVPTNNAAWDGLRGRVIGETVSNQPVIATGVNLVFNGDAEYDRGFNGHDELVKLGGAWDDQRDQPTEGLWWDQHVSGWDDWSQTPSRNSMTVMFYGSGSTATGASGIKLFPDDSDAGPSNRGDNFFSGGIDGNSIMTQRIDISSMGDTSELGFQMSAYLGGYQSEEDKSDFIVRFLDTGGGEISRETLVGASAADRGNQTGLLLRSLSGAVPANVNFIEFLLQTTGEDAYADSLSFMLTDGVIITGDFDNDSDIDGQDWLLFVAELGSTSPSNPATDLTHDGIVNYSDFLQFKSIFENANGIGSLQEINSRIPEPSSLAVLGISGLLIWCRRQTFPDCFLATK